MLHLFVLKSGSPDADPIKTMLSFDDHFGVWTKANELPDVQKFLPVKTPWYAVVYDDEIIDERMNEALPVYLRDETPADVLVLMKRIFVNGDPQITQSPRIFRREFLIGVDGLMPLDKSARFQRCLDGWVKSVPD